MRSEERKFQRKTAHERSIILLFALIVSLSVFSGTAFSDADSISVDVTTTQDGDYTRVDISGILIADGMPKQGAVIGIVVTQDAGRNVFADEVVTDGEGEYSSSFKILTENSGAYTVYAAPASAYAENMVASETFNLGCVEEWVCTGWSVCNSNLRQTRTCTDNSQCGTALDKPATSRECTCALQGGDICRTSETCSGYFIDATDTNYCCDGVCKSKTTTSSTSSSSSYSSSTSTTDTEDEEDSTDTEAEDEEDSAIEDDTSGEDETGINNTSNITDETDHVDQFENKTEDISENPSDENNTPTGMFEAVVGSPRWIAVDVILIMIVVVFAGRILAGRKNSKNKKTEKETTLSGWSNGKYKYKQTDTRSMARRMTATKQKKEIHKAPDIRTKMVKVRI